MKNNSISHSQRQRKIWFEITKRNAILSQEKNEDSTSTIILPKEEKDIDEELVVSER